MRLQGTGITLLERKGEERKGKERRGEETDGLDLSADLWRVAVVNEAVGTREAEAAQRLPHRPDLVDARVVQLDVHEGFLAQTLENETRDHRRGDWLSVSL